MQTRFLLVCITLGNDMSAAYVRDSVADLIQLDPRFLPQKKSYEENLLNIALVCGADVNEIPN